MKRLISSIISFCLVMTLSVSLSLAELGVTDNEVLIGTSLALEGPANYLGIQTLHGLDTLVKEVNGTGGINGRKIRIVSYNDSYDPLTCVKNTQQLINEDKVFALSCYVGTPTSVKTMPVWTMAKVPLIGFFTGAEALRAPFNIYNFHIRASYYQETAAMIDVMVNKLKFKKIAIFYQYDAFGEAVKKGAELALTKFNMTPVAFGNFERSTLNVEEGLAKIKDSNPDAIVMAGTYAPLAKFVKEAKKAGLTKTIFYTVSFVGPEAFAKELGADTGNCLVSQVMPPYMTSKLPVVAQYISALKQTYPEDSPNFVSFESYVNGLVLIEGIKRAGQNLTRAGLISAIESIKPGQMGAGLQLGYGSEDHQGLTSVYLTQIINGNYFEIKDWSGFAK